MAEQVDVEKRLVKQLRDTLEKWQSTRQDQTDEMKKIQIEFESLQFTEYGSETTGGDGVSTETPSNVSVCKGVKEIYEKDYENSSRPEKGM